MPGRSVPAFAVAGRARRRARTQGRRLTAAVISASSAARRPRRKAICRVSSIWPLNGRGVAGRTDDARVGACRLSVDGGDRAPPSGESWVMTVPSGKARDQAASRSKPASFSSPVSGSVPSSPPPSPSSPVAGLTQPAPERPCRRFAAAASSSGVSRNSAPG